MKTSWVKGLKGTAESEVRESFQHSTVMRSRLIALLDEKLIASGVNSRSKDNYSLAGWAYLQADAVGYERALKEVISLISSESVE
jgi:hypothetical protein